MRRCIPALLVLLGWSAPGPVPTEVVRVDTYTEGVTFDHDGNLFFSHGKRISRMSPDGKLSLWADTGAPNGHKVLADGTHLVCDGSQRAVLRLDANGNLIGRRSVSSEGKPLRAPNDLALDSRKGFYFTDPGGSHSSATGTIHYVSAQGVTTTSAGGLQFPNGIVLRPGGRSLLVAESGKNQILEFSILTPGKLAGMRVFARLPTAAGDQVDNRPGGLCLDTNGNLYVAHYGMGEVQVLDRSGKLMARLPAGNLMTSNVVFGGPKLNQLFVGGSVRPHGEGALFRIDMGETRGLDLPPRSGPAR